MTVSAFDSPMLAPLVGDSEVAGLFSVQADIRVMLAFEGALARAEASVGLVPAEAAAHIASVCETFSPEIGDLAAGAAKDGVVVPALVKLLRAKVGAPHDVHVHRGATSQDVIDTSLVLRLKPVLAVYETRLRALIERLRSSKRARAASR